MMGNTLLKDKKMTLFEQIVSEILCENVGIGKINDAINRTYEVEINYHSENDNASGKRIIQPVAYGLSKAGNPVIRAYQPYGDTQTSVPSWKMFLLSGIQSWKPKYKQTFRQPADGFNPVDDKSMSVVYTIAKFWDTHQEKEEPIKANGPVKKTDLETPNHISVKDNEKVKKMEKLKKQLENPTYIQDLNKKQENTPQEVGSGPVTKSDIESSNVIKAKDNEAVKNLEILRKKLDNPIYISDIIKNKTFNDEEETKTQEEIPVNNNFQTQTEKDIQSRQQQFNKNQRVSQSVLDNWKREQERKNKNRLK